MATKSRDFLSDTAAKAVQLAFPSRIKTVRGISPQTVWKARCDGGALTTVAAMIHAAQSRENAEALVAYLEAHLEARFMADDRDINELHRLEHLANAAEDAATTEYVINPSPDTARTLLTASLNECAIERTRQAVLIRRHFVEAA